MERPLCIEETQERKALQEAENSSEKLSVPLEASLTPPWMTIRLAQEFEKAADFSKIRRRVAPEKARTKTRSGAGQERA